MQCKTATNILQFGGMFLSSTLQASVFMGKNYSENLHSIKNTGKDLTMKQMFDIFEKLIIGQSDEISWSAWKGESETNIGCCLGGKIELVQRFITIQNFGHNWRRAPMEFEWNISQDSPHCSTSAKSTSSWLKCAIHHNSKDELSSCRCSMTSYGDLKTMNGSAVLTPHLCQNLQKDSKQDVGHSSDLDQKQSGILLTLTDPKENGTESLNWWWSSSEKADTQFSDPRVHLSRWTLKSEGGGKLSFTLLALTRDTIETVFRTIVSVNQLSIYRPVSNLCDEYQCLSSKNGETSYGQRAIWPILFEPARLLMTTLTPSTEAPAQDFFCKSTKNEWKGSRNKIVDSSPFLSQEAYGVLLFPLPQ